MKEKFIYFPILLKALEPDMFQINLGPVVDRMDRAMQ